MMKRKDGRRLKKKCWRIAVQYTQNDLEADYLAQKIFNLIRKETKNVRTSLADDVPVGTIAKPEPGSTAQDL